jgi:Porin subfamily
MIKRKMKGGIALGSLTAAVALLAGLSSASAQGAPGAGSFPRSFLVPGTNTSLAIYGRVLTSFSTNLGSQHVTDTSPAGIGNTAAAINQLALGGPGAAGGNSVNNQEHAIHGGLRGQVKSTQIFFETRTPSDLGEVKTVVMMDFGAFGLQSNYIGKSSSTTTPSSGAGNNEGPRIQFAYGTLGPWLIGQYLSAYMDPLMFTPGIGDQSQIGILTTRNIRRPQIRYTYLAGNGLTLSAALETNTYTNLVGLNTTTVVPVAENSTDTGGITNYPSFNAGVAWTQPWGHLMARFGLAENEMRSTTGRSIAGNSNVNMKKLGWGVEAGAMINTWGHDQWRGLVSYAAGADAFQTDMGDNAYVDSVTGSMEQIKELAFITSYKHVFSPHWFTTAEFSMGFFNKPSNVNDALNTLTNTANGATGAGLAGIEKRHLQSALGVVYSPLPGKVNIALEWDHWDRWVQASSTSGNSNRYALKFFFFW